MGKEKAGFLTPKAIANRIKAKGLQKLRWYCQMCQKQCRDENGFKCHLTSESHQRQLLLFAENPDTYLDTFSQEFEDTFLELVRRRFGTKRVQANQVYQEYISDRDHVHMNSTQWETLTDFVKWLGREGKCMVDQTEKGWFLAYVDRDPEAIRRQAEKQAKVKMELDDEEKTAKFIQKQIERAAEQSKEKPDTEFTELKRENEEEKVTFNLGAAVEKKPEKTTVVFKFPKVNPSRDEPSTSSASSSTKQKVEVGQKRKSALDEIMEMEEKKREKINRKDYWLHKGVVVKVVSKKVGEKYYKKKAVIKDVIDNFGAVISMLDSGDKLKVDQVHLETVIPAEGKSILVVNGAYRGREATLVGLDQKAFSCRIKISSGPLKGRVLDKIEFEDISKLHQPS